MVDEQKPAEQKKQDPHEKMMLAFDSRRTELSDEMSVAAAAFKNTTDLLNAEHKLYAVRIKLVDYKRELSMAISTLNKQLKRMKNERMMSHKDNKLAVKPANPTEKKAMDDAYFGTVTETIEKFDAQFDWTKDHIAGCDEMSNGISYYIKLAALLGGTINR